MTNKEEAQRIKQMELTPDRIVRLSAGVDPEWRGKIVRVLSTRVQPKTKRPLVTVEGTNDSSGIQKEVLPSHCLEIV